MTKPKIVAIIQARMGSSRLPGKVLLDLGGKPMLQHVVERTRRAAAVEQVVVATTVEPADDALAEFCAAQGYPVARGSLHDVLDRYYQAARAWEAEVVVRITADCPLIDPALIDLTVNAFLGHVPLEKHWLTNGLVPATSAALPPNALIPHSFDFAANRLPPPWGRTYPIGLDTEVCSFAGLETAWREAREPHQREHVMPYFYDHQERFRLLLVNHAEDYGAQRWTVDTPADLELLRRIFERLDGQEDFSWLDVLALVEREPELARINAGVQHKDYREVDRRRENNANLR